MRRHILYICGLLGSVGIMSASSPAAAQSPQSMSYCGATASVATQAPPASLPENLKKLLGVWTGSVAGDGFPTDPSCRAYVIQNVSADGSVNLMTFWGPASWYTRTPGSRPESGKVSPDGKNVELAGTNSTVYLQIDGDHMTLRTRSPRSGKSYIGTLVKQASANH